MVSSIQVDEALLEELRARKLSPRETYADVIRDMIEDVSALNQETLDELKQARREAKQGDTYTSEQIKAEFKLP